MRASVIVWLCCALTLTAARADQSPWTSRDYVDFYFRHYNGHVPLPHLRDEAQKVLFNHLIDPGNITLIEQALVSNDEKLRQLRIILAILGSYRAAYNVAVIVGEPLQQELTLVQIHTLEVADAVAKLVRLSQADEGASTAWATLVEGVIESVGDSKRYSSSPARPHGGCQSPCTIPPSPRFFPGDERHRLDEALKRMKQALPAAP